MRIRRNDQEKGNNFLIKLIMEIIWSLYDAVLKNNKEKN